MTTADRDSLRYRVIADLPMIGAFPILAQLEGSRRRTGIIVQAPGLLIPHLADQGAHSCDDRLLTLEDAQIDS